MNVNITDEQILEIAEKRINQLVDTRVKEVLNSEYWQTMSERIDVAVRNAVNKMVTESRIDKALSRIDTQKLILDMSGRIAENIVNSISIE